MTGRNAIRTGLAVAVAGLAAACVDEQPTEPTDRLTETPTAVATRSASPRGLDGAFSRIAAEAPGFGGVFYDDAGRLNVQVTPEAMEARGGRERILAAVGRHMGGRSAAAASAQNVVFQQAGQDFLRLHELRQQLRPIFNVEGVVYTDVDETTNRLRIGVLPGTPESRIVNALEDLGVPGELVVVQTSPAIERFSGETLQDKVQPVGGGLQLVWEYPGIGFFLCTLGFNVLRDEPGRSQPYFITNSHCTGDQGVVTGTEYYQPAPPPFVTDYNLLGFEVLDPPFFTGPSCYVGFVCRFSDAALVKYYRNNPVRFGSIYRTEFVGTTGPGSLDIASSGKKFFSINDEVPFPLGGEILDKVGRTTGWTRGEVIVTCADILVSGTNIVLLCQDIVAAVSAGGDSGSPVFQPTRNGKNATLYGILWGGGTGIFAFSALENIRFELGDFATP